MFAVINTSGKDSGPIINNRPYASWIYVLFLSITTFFVMNLFDSVIVDKFNEEIKKREGAHNFSEEQKEWVKMQRIMVTVNPKLDPIYPKNIFRLKCFELAQSH